MAYLPKILVVDDEMEARMGLARSLRSKGYEVIEASTGQEVLPRAKAEWPALIILDVILPDIAGTEVLKALREDPITKNIPVLLLTAKPDIVGKVVSFREQSDQYFEKPGRVEDLLSMVQNMLTGPKKGKPA